MKKRVDFDMWYQNNEIGLNYLLKDMFKSLNELDIPQTFNVDFDFNDNLKDALLQYMYNNSSTALQPSMGES